MGWRNWLFAGTVSGTKASAHLYSLVQTARAHELEPYAYLRRLFTFLQGLGHCGECHTPRSVAMQMKATSPAGGAAYLSGAVIENYFAPSLRNSGPGTLGAWSVEDELAQFLKTGANADGIAFGSMSDVIIHSTQYMAPADALATAKYLKALRNPDEEPATRFTYDATEHLASRTGMRANQER